MRIAEYISKSLRSALSIAIAAQIAVTCFVLPFLAYNDAIKRARFLATSNLNSIAVMMSTGDMFQTRILLNSFVSEQIPLATVIDSDGVDIRAREKSPYQKYINRGEGILLAEKGFVVLTNRKVIYNDVQVGTLEFPGFCRVFS